MKLRLLIFSFVITGWSIAQQQAVYSSFVMNDYFYNPAVAGSKDVHLATFGYRNQWVGFNDAPVNFNANFYGSVKNQMKHGYGVSVVNQQSGITGQTGVYLNYAYHVKFNDNLRLGLGVRPGYLQYNVKLYDAQVADAGDEVLTGSIRSANAFDMNSGFNLYNGKFFLMGSFSHMLGKSIRFTSYNSALALHYNLIGGYNFVIPKKKLEIQPSVMYKHVRPIPGQFTAMCKVTYNKKFWGALIYRDQDAAGIAAGMTIKERFQVGYGFDYSISGIKNQQSGSHEIMLGFVITKKKPTLDEEDDKLNKSIMDDLQKEQDKQKQETPTKDQNTTDEI